MKKKFADFGQILVPKLRHTFCLLFAVTDLNTVSSSIIRCPELSQTRSHFTDRYEWVREKHGLGPVHFHTSVGVHEVEIYPLRKQQIEKKMNLEFFFNITSMDLIPPELQVQDRTLWTLQDPKGRTFIVGLLKQD